MVSRGQGAMEYLMTYGWAILVVMIVGAVVWNLGLVNLGGSVAPTASGFSGFIKPLLASCEISHNMGAGSTSIHGFTCIFTNTAPKELHIKSADITLNGYRCGYWILSTQQFAYAGAGPYFDTLWGWTSNEKNPTWGINGACNGGPLCPSNYFIALPDKIFHFETSHVQPDPNYAHCANFDVPQGNIIKIQFDYDVEVGGMMTSKSDTGTIILAGKTT